MYIYLCIIYEYSPKRQVTSGFLRSNSATGRFGSQEDLERADFLEGCSLPRLHGNKIQQPKSMRERTKCLHVAPGDVGAKTKLCANLSSFGCKEVSTMRNILKSY